MKYYILNYDFENGDNDIMLNTDDDTGRYDVEDGKYINNWKELTFYYDLIEGYKKTDYVSNVLSWFIVTEKFRKLIESIEEDAVQFLKINTLERNNKMEINDCYVGNICNIVDALDLNNSKYDEFEVDENLKMLSIERYALTLTKIGNSSIFRLKDDMVSIFISENLKMEIESNNITGCSFEEVKVI